MSLINTPWNIRIAFELHGYIVYYVWKEAEKSGASREK